MRSNAEAIPIYACQSRIMEWCMKPSHMRLPTQIRNGGNKKKGEYLANPNFQTFSPL